MCIRDREDAEHPGRSFATAELPDLTLIERNALDFARAGIVWLHTRADSGDAQAQAALGWLYETGVAVGQDDALAVAWYARAAHGGDPFGQFNFALRCERGRGIAISLAEAARWYLASAEQGVGPATVSYTHLDVYKRQQSSADGPRSPTMPGWTIRHRWRDHTD